MIEQNLTLLGINLEITRLLQKREDAATNPDLTPEEITRELAAYDEQIKTLVLREVKKADGIAYNLTEFKRRVGKCWDRGWEEPGAIDLEIERLKALKAQWLARYDYLEEVTIRALQFIEQTEGRKRVEGETSILGLRNNPPSVDVHQPELVPEEYQRCELKFTVRFWQAVEATLRSIGTNLPASYADAIYIALCDAEREPMKKEIATVLKQSDPCANCKGSGKLPGVDWGRCSWCGEMIGSQHKPSCGRQGMVTEASDHSDKNECHQCGGSGSIPRGIPGARLVSGVRLEVK